MTDECGCDNFQSSRNFRILQTFVLGLETSILQMMNQMETDLIIQNKFLQERIIILEENQETLKNDIRLKDLQLQKLENVFTAPNKKVFKPKNTKIKSELEDKTIGNIVIKSELGDTTTTSLLKTEITEDVESNCVKSSEYFEFDSNTVIKDEIETDKGKGDCAKNKEIIAKLANAKPQTLKMKKRKRAEEERIRRRIEKRIKSIE